MDSLENLHYAIGQLAFAVAFADGNLQKEEHDCFRNIVVQELQNDSYDFDVSDIVFHILEKDRIDTETVYEWAMKEIRTNAHYLSPELKKKFITVMEKVSNAYPPVTHEETNLINRFKKDIEGIHGDPVFYQK
ncbi:MAG: hypothetical protein K0R26_2726 [Bacteroidota bacterium]|jgi:uncharacterized tellurite resistance protein B-like protein|nr:hypothetical protein [Bacteroidota bacterium]